MADDFGSMEATPRDPKRKRIGTESEGTERTYLRIYETLPCQLLNAYGMAKYPKLSDSAAWAGMCEPLKSGAMYMTEYASPEAERRGIAVNRFLQCVLEFCLYQKTAEVEKQNKSIMQEKIRKELYEEIERILPAIEYCLAPKKPYAKKGASMLRSAAGPPNTPEVKAKDPQQLDEYAKALYEWMDTQRVSRIRMMLQWQGGGGLPYVASVHHRATQCFRYEGNSKHEAAGKSAKGVSLEEWQEAVKERHRVGCSGIDEGQPVQSIDFN